jgi:hypothetical protein
MNRKNIISKTAWLIALFISVIALSGYRGEAYAVTYYVAKPPTGSDSHPGSAAQPFATIQHAINVAVSGDAVSVAAGTYSENVIMKSGVSVIGESPAVTSIMGAASTNGVVLFDSIRNAVLKGFRITVSNPVSGVDRGVVFQGATDSTAVIQNCIITNVQYGIFVWNPSGLDPTPTIQNNILFAVPDIHGIFDEQGIYIGNIATAPTIRNNIITRYAYAGIHVVAGNNLPTPIIEYNDVYSNGDGGDYVNYESQTGINGNISVLPRFVSLGVDFNLGEGSPCIDAGDPDSQYNDPDGSRNDMGAFGGPCTYLSPESQQVPAAGGTGFSFSVLTSLLDCSWSTGRTGSWITDVSPVDAVTGNGTVTYDVSPNTGPVRQGAIAIGGEIFTIAQNGIYSLNLIKNGTGTGTVVSNETPTKKINCGTSCTQTSATYESGTQVILTATSNDSAFSGWSGACAGTGSCQLTMNGNKTVYATFTKQTSPVVTTQAGQGGSIDPTSRTVEYGDTTQFTVSADAGYHIASVSGCGGTPYANAAKNKRKVKAAAISELVYTTGQITGACTVTASFVESTYTVTPGAGAHGSMSPSKPQTVKYLEQVIFEVTPDDHYHIKSVSGCGVTKYQGGAVIARERKSKKIGKSAASGEKYITEAISGDCTVSAEFGPDAYTVTPSAGEHGSISPSTEQTVNYTDMVSFLVKADDGYHIESVTGCGGTPYSSIAKKKKKRKLTAVSEMTYTSGHITESCTVTASFAVNTLTVTPKAGAHGSISPSTPQGVNPQERVLFEIAADEHYHIVSVSGCGISVAEGGGYITEPITADCTVEAEFAADLYETTITKTGTGSGTVTGSGLTCEGEACTGSYAPGTKVVLKIQPDAGSRIIDVKINGVSLGAVNTLSIKQMLDNYSIEIVFGPV